ncbi:MAG: lysophospholipid acyltransferase family protein [Isosphaeraceae bacterium]
MNRLPLTDQFPYRFTRPRLNPAYLWLMRRTLGRVAWSYAKIERFEVSGLERLRERLGRGDGVLLTPNHSDHGDSFSMLHLGAKVGRPFYFMVAHQILHGFRGHLMRRLGAFPVDREGADLNAFRAAVEVLGQGRNPLVIFPEGEIHHLGDRVTPLREGAAAIALSAYKRLADAGKTVWVVPVGLKYRFVDGHDPLPALHEIMDELERRALWWVGRDRPLVPRIYRYAEGMMGLKEFEYLGAARSGPLPERLAFLREHILTKLEARHRPAASKKAADVPERVKEVRRACLEALADPATTPERARELRRDLHDVFVAFQTFSYPGDYLRHGATVERLSETLMKCEEDFLGVHEVTPRGPRRALIQIGEPIDVRAQVAAVSRLRLAASALTDELESRIQAALDVLGPGRALPTECLGTLEASKP